LRYPNYRFDFFRDLIFISKLALMGHRTFVINTHL